MNENDAVIIVGSLNDKELRNSINELVEFVNGKTDDMAEDFREGIDKMKLAMKDFAITQKVSVDLMKEAWRDMSKSFDAMVAAQSTATGSSRGGGGGGKPQYPDNTVGNLEEIIRLEEKRRKEMELGSDELREQNTLIEELKNTRKSETTSKKTLKDVLGMDENSVEAVAKKMRELKRIQIDPNNAKQAKLLGDEYQRLSRKQAELLGKNIQLTHSNNYLAQSFGYIRNRIAYALTLGAITNFTKQIYEVRGQYELLERSLGILIDNMRRGSEIFNELNEMSLKSPFTLTELATGAKQLMAYNFTEDEVIETTRRLADISSALGVPMERLVYNLGQIRAQTVLTARDARDFANAGLAIVPMLADLYTKQKKFGDEIVTTSQVYDMMSNKMVTYADVMKVINNITDEGGKFFDFQAKQAETMKVQMNNLALAWNNMLNEIGKDNQGLLAAPLKGLKLLFENWKTLEKAIKAAVVAIGMYYTRATLVKLINGTLITQGTIRAGYLLAAGFNAAKNALIGLRTVIMTNPLGALTVAISTAIGFMGLFNDGVNEMTEYNNRFGESGGSVVRDVEALYGSIESLNKGSATYKKVVAELNQLLGDFNLAQIDEKSNIDEILKSREKNIQLIKEEILERKHLNDLQQGRDTYEESIKKARERLRSNLSDAVTENFLGIGTINEEITKNAPALTNIIFDIIESNIELVANKTGEEYEKGVEKIFAKINERLKNNKALGLSEETLNSSWLENNLFRFDSNIIANVIDDLKEAKEANDQYNESVNENYEAEKQAAEQGATFNDRVKQTSDALLKAANDTDKFYGKINQLVKDYSGQNIVDFLVRVNAQVPEWMTKMSGTELAQFSARFAALASQAKKARKEGLVENGIYFTTQQLYERAAQYASAVQQKQADAEARKTTTITKEASQAFQEYKQSLDAVRVARNRMKQGTADQTLVTEKETEAQKKFNAALQKGVSLEDLKNAKYGKQTKTQKDPLGDALQKEIQLINDIQKIYKEYRKAGVDAETAKTAAANEYTNSLQTQNAQLKRFGIKGLTGEQLATMDLREIRDYYQSMLDVASKLNNVKGVEVLEKALRGINGEITKLDYKKITDGLNSELGKLKDEYELAVELDANPELGNVFADLFDIDAESLPHTIDQYADNVLKALNKSFKERDIDLNLPTLDLTRDDIKAYKDMLDADVLDQETFDKIKKSSEEIKNLRKKDAEDTVKQTQELQYKLADTNGKIAIEAEKLSVLQKRYEKETQEEKKRLLELQIQDQQNAIAKLKEEVLQLLPTYVNLFNSIAEHSASVTRRLAKQWKDALHNAVLNMDGTYTITDPLSGEKATITAKQYGTQIDKVNGKLRETETSWQKIKEAFTKKDEDGIVDWQQGLSLVGDEISNIANSLQELSSILEDVGVKFSDDINYAIEGLSQVGSGVSEFAQGFASGNWIQAAVGGIKAVVGLGKTAAGIFGGTKRDYFTELNNSLQGLLDTLNKVADYQLEALGKMTGSKAASEYRKMIENNEMAIKSYRDLAEARGRSGSSWGSHSYAYRTNRELKNDWEEISKYAGQTVTSIQDMYNLSPENLKEIMTNMPVQWSKIDEEIRKALESIIEYGDKANEYTEALGVAMTNMSLDDLVNDFENMLQDMDSDAEDFSENFEEYMRNAIIRSMMVGTYAKELENWYINFKNRITDDQLSDSDIAALREEYMDIVNRALTERDRLLSVVGTSAGSDNLSALQQGIQSVSEDTASALEAYMNGVSQQVYLQSDILAQIRDAVVSFDMDVQLGVFSQMLLQLQQSYIVQQNIENLLQNVINPSGRAFMVELAS